jgi:glycerophosphoryl diester phosphodiesterase
MLLRELHSHDVLADFNNRRSVYPLAIQSFDTNCLKTLHEKGGVGLTLIQLVNVSFFHAQVCSIDETVAGGDLNTCSSTNESSDCGCDSDHVHVLKQISTYANGVGLDKQILGSISFRAAKGIVDDAHDLGLVVHPWTFRKDFDVLPQFEGDFEAESEYFLCCLGVDGIFTEHPGQTRFLVDSLHKRRQKVAVVEGGGLAQSIAGASASACTLQCASVSDEAS